jgi:hypothetical protein
MKRRLVALAALLVATCLLEGGVNFYPSSRNYPTSHRYPSAVSATASVHYYPNPFGSSTSLLTGLVSYWPLTSNGNDSYGTNHLTNINAVTFVAKGGGAPSNIPATVANFIAASSQRFQIADNANTVWGEDGNGATMVLWIKPAGVPSGIAMLFGRDSLTASERNFAIYTNSGALSLLTDVNAGSQHQGAGATLTDATWTMVTMWFDPSDKTLRTSYNNAGTIADAPAQPGVSLTAAAANIVIGGRTDTPGHINGNIALVGIWKKVLSAGERTYLYNAGAANVYPFVGGPT